MGDAAKRTATQRFFDVMESKEVIETDLWACSGSRKDGEVLGREGRPRSEFRKISDTYVDACFTAGPTLMNNEKTQKCAVEADSDGLTPFDSIYTSTKQW